MRPTLPTILADARPFSRTRLIASAVWRIAYRLPVSLTPFERDPRNPAGSPRIHRRALAKHDYLFVPRRAPLNRSSGTFDHRAKAILPQAPAVNRFYIETPVTPDFEGWQLPALQLAIDR